MFIIGLTGGIGSGKSAAAKVLKELGLKVASMKWNFFAIINVVIA